MLSEIATRQNAIVYVVDPDDAVRDALEPIWRGRVERALYPSDRDDAESVIEQAVPALFESLPP